MKIYYEDYRLKVVENDLGKYDVYDTKFGGRMVRKNMDKDAVDKKISEVLNKRPRLKRTELKNVSTK